MPQFLQRFSRIEDGAASADFWKGLLTAMLQLGAFFGAYHHQSTPQHSFEMLTSTGALNMGWIADKYSRKYSIVIAVAVFSVGSALQTAAVDYAMLTVARTIGGIGIGM